MKRLLTALILLMVPALVLAQAQTTGQISGKVIDEAGSPIEGAEITVTNTETGLERTGTAGANGQFLFGVLPVGNYTVLVQHVGMQPQVYSFRLGVGETVPVEVTLLPGEVLTEEIAVYATATALQTTSSGENFDYRETVEELPIQDRDIQDIAMLSPNVSPNGPHTNSERDASGGGYSIAGAMTTDTVVLLDGSEVSDPFFGGAPVLYLEDAIEEVQVLTSGISARYGRFQGGVVNAITKSGSNQFEATLRMELANEDWNSTSPFGEVQEDDLQEVYQGTVGGYILQDRLWFFGGLRTFPDLSVAETTQATGESVTRTDAEDRWQIKLRGAPMANHIFDVSHLDYERERSNRAGLAAGDLPAHTGMRLDDRTADTVSYQGVITPTTFLEIRGTQKEVAIASGGDPANGDPIFDLVQGFVFNNHWWDFNDPSVRDNDTLSANVTQALETENLGIHTLEAGVQYVSSVTGGENRQSSTGFNMLTFNSDIFAGQDPSGASLFNVRTGAALRWKALVLGGDQELENTAFYVQDTVDWGKWRFDFGLRYDDYSGTGPLPTFDIGFDDIAPRLGVTYNLTPDWQLLGTWGKYVARFNDGVGNDATGVSSAPRISQLYVGPDFDTLTGDEVGTVLRNEDFWGPIVDYVDPTQPTTFLGDNLHAPYAEDFTFSIRHALANNAGSVMFQYINREFRAILDDFVGSACSHPEVIFGGCSPFTSVVDPDGNEATVDTTVWANTSRAHREYEAFSLQFDLRPGRKWGIGGNYTFGENQGNHEGENTNQPAVGTELGDFVLSRPEDAATPFGLTDEDITHRAQLWGTYRYGLERWGDLAFSGIFNFTSGATYSLISGVEYLDQPDYITEAGNTYNHFHDGRGQNRLDDVWWMDLSVRYQVPLVSRLELWLKLTAQNVLNNDELIGFQTSGETWFRDPDTGLLIHPTTGDLTPFPTFIPTGNCGVGDTPSEDCTGFGRIRSERDYQIPREIFFTVGLRF